MTPYLVAGLLVGAYLVGALTKLAAIPMEEPMTTTVTRTKDCPSCGTQASVELNRHCGAWVCLECDHHQGLARCFCGWSRSGQDGRQELIEMGETIDPD